TATGFYFARPNIRAPGIKRRQSQRKQESDSAYLVLLSLWRDRRSVAAIAGSRRRTGFQPLAGLRKCHEPGVSPIRAVAGSPSEHCDRVSREHRLRLFPANPIQNDGWISLEFPVRNVSAFVLHIHEEIEMGICPLDTGNDTRQRDGFVAVVLRAERMMRKKRSGGQQEKCKWNRIHVAPSGEEYRQNIIRI